MGAGGSLPLRHDGVPTVWVRSSRRSLYSGTATADAAASGARVGSARLARRDPVTYEPTTRGGHAAMHACTWRMPVGGWKPL